MFKSEVQKEVQFHYNKLIELGYEVVGVFLYGSQNYDLDYEGSDVDTKAIVLPKLEDIVLNRKPVSTTIDMGNKCLCDVKDIRVMFDCFKKQNINYIELLFTQYYVLNPLYKSMYRPMLDNAERIARYNVIASLNCMSGMALEKYNALDHPYPSIKDKIDKYGFDSKQLHHILRLEDFIIRYVNGEKYSNILIPTYDKREYLLRVKIEYFYSLEKAKELAKNTCEGIRDIKNNYIIKNNDIIIDYEVENIMNNVLTNIIKYAIIREVKED